MKRANLVLGAVLSLFLGVISVLAQTSEFTFQGKLSESGAPVSTPRDMIFRLWDETNTVQIGSDIEVNNVQFNNGVFTVQLDFGPASFEGGDRWLETLISLPGVNDYTALAPRQKFTSAPYAIRALESDTAQTANTAVNAANASQLGGIAANQYVLTSDARLSNARTPLPGSTSYIQNQNGGAQSGTNFFIGGTGRANQFIASSIGVNTTAPTTPLDVAGIVSSSGSQAGYYFSDRGTPSARWILYSSSFEARFNIGGVDRLAISPTGLLSVANLSGSVSTHVCWDTSSGYFSFCSSSIRYKTNVDNYSGGPDVLKKLRPVSFEWKNNGRREIGFIAEEVAAVAPHLAFKNKEDIIEGVSYDQITTVLVDVVKQQQDRIERQELRIKELTTLVCRLFPDDEICSPSPMDK
ncbi:MAG: tail fiber domain-containing protein [Acidobacteria bacterium]|nr:tail fiber domain-containing protein [Acidobacteriota bacterium]